jgi:hypothetical protein
VTLVRITGALLGILITLPAAAAGGCALPPEPIVAPIPRANWQDIAKFSFLVGTDFNGNQGNNELAARLRELSSFAPLRASSATWKDTWARSVALANQVVKLTNLLPDLAGLCRQLDDAGIGGKPLDLATWIREMATVRGRLATTVANLQVNAPPGSFRTALETFAVNAGNAARSYTDARFPDPPVLPIDPSPVRVANEIGQVWADWRTIIADLVHLSSTLPQRPDPDSEKVLADIAAAMPLLARSVAGARSILAQDLSATEFHHLTSGDYLYDACPIPENTDLSLFNSRYTLTVMTPGPASTSLFLGATTSPPTWRFRRIGQGYWQIVNKDGSSLDVANDPTASYPLKVVSTDPGRPKFSGQYWRCFATPQRGFYRFVTQFLGEDWSMGVAGVGANGRIEVKMLKTANNPTQYWAPRPRW